MLAVGRRTDERRVTQHEACQEILAPSLHEEHYLENRLHAIDMHRLFFANILVSYHADPSIRVSSSTSILPSLPPVETNLYQAQCRSI